MIDRNDQGQQQVENLAEIDVRGDTAVRLLRNFVDADFRNYIPSLMENAPHAVETINEDYQGTGKDKFVHTQQTLQLLDTNGLSEADRFIARTSMMFHDANPGKAITDLARWVKSGLVTNEEAVDIMQQVWWHDLLGVDVNKGLNHTGEITQVIPDGNERMINLRVFQADITSYGLESYKHVVEQVPTLPANETTTLEIEEVRSRGLTDLQAPDDADIFIHGIYYRGHQTNIREFTPKVLMNMLTSGNIRSTSLLTNLENFKVASESLGGKATDRELNMFRFQPGNYPTEISQFGQSEQNWLKVVLLGRDIKQDCAVKPLTLAEQTTYVAGLVNRFDEAGKPVGAEIGIDKAYFMVAPDAAQALIPIIKLEAIRLNQDPEQWVMRRVIVDDGKRTDQLLTQLATGELNIREHNTQSLLETLNYSGFTYTGILRDNFSTVQIDGSEELHLGQSENAPTACRVIDVMNMSIESAESRLNGLVNAIPEIANEERVKTLRTQIEVDKVSRERIIGQVKTGNGIHYDEQSHSLYIEGQSYGGIVVIDNVAGFTQHVENADSEFSRATQYEIKLIDGKTITIKKSKFQFD